MKFLMLVFAGSCALCILAPAEAQHAVMPEETSPPIPNVTLQHVADIEQWMQEGVFMGELDRPVEEVIAEAKDIVELPEGLETATLQHLSQMIATSFGESVDLAGDPALVERVRTYLISGIDIASDRPVAFLDLGDYYTFDENPDFYMPDDVYFDLIFSHHPELYRRASDVPPAADDSDPGDPDEQHTDHPDDLPAVPAPIRAIDRPIPKSLVIPNGGHYSFASVFIDPAWAGSNPGEGGALGADVAQKIAALVAAGNNLDWADLGVSTNTAGLYSTQLLCVGPQAVVIVIKAKKTVVKYVLDGAFSVVINTMEDGLGVNMSYLRSFYEFGKDLIDFFTGGWLEKPAESFTDAMNWAFDDMVKLQPDLVESQLNAQTDLLVAERELKEALRKLKKFLEEGGQVSWPSLTDNYCHNFNAWHWNHGSLSGYLK